MPNYTLILDPPHPDMPNLATDDDRTAGAWVAVVLAYEFAPARTMHVLVSGKDVAVRLVNGLPNDLTALDPDVIATRLTSLSVTSITRATDAETITRKAA